MDQNLEMDQNPSLDKKFQFFSTVLRDISFHVYCKQKVLY